MRWNSWNLLLLFPLFSLLTAMYNRVEPELFGIPFFYWFQLTGVFVGVGATALVSVMTKDTAYVVTDRPEPLDVDPFDDGDLR